MEIERKWLLDINNIPYDLNQYEHEDIEQAYISFSPTIRIRKITNKGLYILTTKSKSLNGGLSRQEYELDINEDQYNNLLTKTEGIVLSKTRYKVNVDNLVYEIDLFHNEYEGLAYLEIEFNSEEEARNFVSPNFVVKELTGDSKHSNASLARGIR